MIVLEKRREYIGLLASGSSIILALSLAATKPRGADLPWHLKTGELILKRMAVPRVDEYSFVRQGAEWIDAQWLFQVITWFFYDRLGAFSITALNMAAAAAIMACFLLLPRRYPMGLLAFIMVLFLVALNPRLTWRPEAPTFFCMALLFVILERARRGRPALLFLAPLVQILWANLEGLWPIGFGIACVYLGELALDKARKANERGFSPPLYAFALVVVALAAAGLCQPYGVKGFLFPLTLLREVALETTYHKQVIREFQPLFASPLYLKQAVPFSLFAACCLAAAALSGRAIRPVLLIFNLILVAMAIMARRNTGIASVALMHLAAVHLEAADPVGKWPALARRLEPAAGILALVLAIFLSVLSLAAPVRTWDSTGREPGFGLSRITYPAQAADLLLSIGYKGNIINDSGLGGYLIWRGWPDWKVFADSRMEVGGEKALKLYNAAFTDPVVFRRLSDQYAAEAVLIRHVGSGQRNFALELAKQDDWALVHLDSVTALFLKRGPKWDKAISAREISLTELIQKRR